MCSVTFELKTENQQKFNAFVLIGLLYI